MMRRLARSWWMLLFLASGACGIEVATEAQAIKNGGPSGGVSDDLKFNRCNPDTIPSQFKPPKACCQDTNNHQYFVSGGSYPDGPPASGPENSMAHRLVGGVSCTADGVNRGCTGRACVWGPCGVRSVESFPAAESQTAYVFYPVSDPSVCGWQSPSGAAYSPEPYVGQTPYPPAEGRCPWTGCTPAGPTAAINVTGVANGATGNLTSTPSGIDLDGAGTIIGAQFTELEIVLLGVPRGLHARAVFSGDCIEVGDYGLNATCPVTLGGRNKVVTVTYECEPGFTCEL
jgi:hypothetical protein